MPVVVIGHQISRWAAMLDYVASLTFILPIAIFRLLTGIMGRPVVSFRLPGIVGAMERFGQHVNEDLTSRCRVRMSRGGILGQALKILDIGALAPTAIESVNTNIIAVDRRNLNVVPAVDDIFKQAVERLAASFRQPQRLADAHITARADDGFNARTFRDHPRKIVRARTPDNQPGIGRRGKNERCGNDRKWSHKNAASRDGVPHGFSTIG